MNYFEKYRKAIIILLSSMFVSGVFFHGFIWKNITSPEDRVAVSLQSSRSLLTDNYYYYIVSMKSLDRLFSDKYQGTSFFSENSGLEDIYKGALLTAGTIDFLAKLLPLDWNEKTAISLFLQLSFLLMSIALFYQKLTKKSFNSPQLIEITIFLFIWCLFSRGFVYGVFNNDYNYIFRVSPLYYPDFLRLVNPQITWASSLLYLATLFWWLSERSLFKYFIVIVASLVLCTYSLPLAACIGLGLGIYGVWKMIVHKEFDIKLLGIGVALITSFFYVNYQFSLFYKSDKGQELGTGSFIGLNIRWSYLYLLAFTPVILKAVSNRYKEVAISIFFASIIMAVFSESFHLGARIWLRGTSIFAYTLILYSVYKLTIEYIRNYYSHQINLKIFELPMLFSVIFLIANISNNDTDTWKGFVDKGKYQVITWLNDNASEKDTVASSDLEDAFYIPIYTRTQPYVQLFDYSVISFEERIDRYFRILKATNEIEPRLQSISDFQLTDRRKYISKIERSQDILVDYQDYQTYEFYTGLIYYPYSKTVENIFSSDKNHEQFFESMRQRAKSADFQDAVEVDYLIVRKDYYHKDLSIYEVAYENDAYLVLEVGMH